MGCTGAAGPNCLAYIMDTASARASELSTERASGRLSERADKRSNERPKERALRPPGLLPQSKSMMAGVRPTRRGSFRFDWPSPPRPPSPPPRPSPRDATAKVIVGAWATTSISYFARIVWHVVGRIAITHRRNSLCWLRLDKLRNHSELRRGLNDAR